MLSYISGTFTAENYIHSITFKLQFSKWKIGKQDSAWVETCNLPFKYNKQMGSEKGTVPSSWKYVWLLHTQASKYGKTFEYILHYIW